MRRVSTALLLVLISATLPAIAQQAQRRPIVPGSPKPLLSPLARLQAATTAFVKKVEGSDIGSDAVVSTLEGWGRYKLVDSPDKADLVIEVTSPAEDSGGVSVSSSSSTASGKYEQSNKSTRELSSGGGPMRLLVRDANTNSTLWAASEQVKGAMKKNSRENNLVEAAQKLVAKFHERVEPVKNPE